MMPWRGQLRLGWKIIRWCVWPPGWPLWLNIFGLLMAVVISLTFVLAAGRLWWVGVAAFGLLMTVVWKATSDWPYNRNGEK